MDKPAPLISATSWVVLDRKTKKVLFGKLEKERKEVASLTKIMTIYTVLRLCDKLAIDIDQKIKIDTSVEDVTGTTANLMAGDTLSV
jgi:D-alanyl-D-alanine carboxypeptidase (penicillin-binding protein 5/6)